MMKSKKGRQTNNSTGKKKSTPPRLRQVRERRKANEAKLNEIDIRSLADDDPSPPLREQRRGFLTLMKDSSSDESSAPKAESTPRKGEDKKRQRFAEQTEIIMVDQDEDMDESIDAPPAPVRLLDSRASDSDTSNPKVTIADILGEGPEEPVEFPQPLVIGKDCRYTCQVKVQPTEHPSQYLASKISELLKWLQNKIGKDVSLATWNDSKEKNHVYARISQLPKPTELTQWTAIWGTWVNIKPQQEGTAFIKLRFVTKSPDKLSKRLPEIGELRDEINK